MTMQKGYAESLCESQTNIGICWLYQHIINHTKRVSIKSGIFFPVAKEFRNGKKKILKEKNAIEYLSWLALTKELL